MKLRTLAKASAVKSGVISQAEAKTNPYVLKIAMRQLSGWTSAGLGRCIQTLAWADEQSKTNGGDPVYEAKTNPYVLKIAMRQLSGWTSAGLGRCIQTLAWADEQSKTNGGDPVYALERAIILIGSKGREH